MRFAINYSVPLENLINAGLVSVELIKCPEWPNIIHFGQKLAACYTHNEIAIGNGRLRDLDFQRIRTGLETTQTPHLNCHLWGSLSNYGDTPEQHEQQLDIWLREIDFLRQNIPGYEIICENLPAEPSMPAWTVSRYPDLLSDFILKSGSGLLLDLSHARITAMNYGMDYQAYIAALPTEKLVELHITGIKTYCSYPEDHFEMQEADWQPTTWAAEQIHQKAWKTPLIVAFEYGGVGDIFSWRTKSQHLLDQVPKLELLFRN